MGNLNFTININMRDIWLWIILISLKTELAITRVLFGWYEEKVIAEEVDRDSFGFKLWLNTVERRNSKVSSERARIEYELGVL